MTFRLGLTGSIGMGKSTTAQLFADAGCAVWDADAVVHRLYAKGGLAVAPIKARLPSAIKDGAVSREQLKKLIAADAEVLKKIERIVHPLVAKNRADFVADAKGDIIVFDIPLLFETGGDAQMDGVVVVSVPPNLQRQRVMARESMSEQQFEYILSKQMPDAEKQHRADYVIVTDTVEHATAQVQDILTEIQRRLAHA